MSVKLTTDEPFFICQSGETMTEKEAQSWFRRTAGEARQEGARWVRFSYHPEIQHLRIVEGWHVRPDDEGDIRWSLTTSRSAK